ncbi:transcription factor MafA-like [Ischnura elegans]|uniref:transcription factor MafA-like n=1 Tax=Ischnura elegans TaxID=197161 RepID=UPI001ED8BC0E|nr:transcription factor MafA-like [Ischnura elegans]
MAPSAKAVGRTLYRPVYFVRGHRLHSCPDASTNMLASKVLLCALGGVFLFANLGGASPAWRDVSGVEDSAIIGSNLWEVSVFAPDDLSAAGTGHSSGGGGGDQGFFKSKSHKGDKGYKAFDSFHKKDGDSYGYEQHSAFGSAKGGEEAAAHQHKTTYQEGDDHHGGHHHNRRRRQHDYGGSHHEGGGGAEHHGYEHHGIGEHSSDHHGGHHSEHHSSSGGGGHHGFF